MRRLCIETGFNLERVIYLGRGSFVAGLSQFWYTMPKLVRFIALIVFWALDGLLLKFSQMFTHKYALGYIFVVRKR